MASITRLKRSGPPSLPIASMSQVPKGKLRAGDWVRVKSGVVVGGDGWHPDLPINAVGYIAGLHSVDDVVENTGWIVRYRVNDKQTFDCYILGSMLEEANVVERLADVAPKEGETP